MRSVFAFVILVLLIHSRPGYAAVLTNWNAALTRMSTGSTEKVVVKFLGDSWTQQGYISGFTATNLQARFGNAGSGFTAASDSGLFYTNATPVIVGTWEDSIICLGGNDNSTPAAVQWTRQCKDAYVIFYLRFGSAEEDSATIYTNGVSAGSVRNPNWDSGDYYSYHVDFGSYSSTNTVKIEVDNNYVNPYGTEFRSGSNGVLVSSIGWSGQTAMGWADAGAGMHLLITNTQPTLVVILLGVNDVDSGIFAGDGMKTNINRIINTVRSYTQADILLVSPADVAVTNGGYSMRDVDSMLEGICATNGCDFVSGYQLFPTYSVGVGLGYYSDAKHLNDLGGNILASNIVSTLIRDYEQATTNWYISPNANGNGTLESPGNITNAVTHVGWASAIEAGHTIWLRSGTYSNIVFEVTNFYAFRIGFSGSSGNMVTWRSYPGEWAKVDGQWTFGTYKYHRFRDLEFYDSHKGDHVVTGYEVQNGPYLQFDSNGASGNEFINCVIHDVNNCWGGGAGGVVRGCILWHIGQNGYEHVSYASVSNLTGNLIGWIAGGIINFSPSPSLISSNIMWSTRSSFLGITDNDTVIGNRLYGDLFDQSYIHTAGIPANKIVVMTNNTFVGDGLPVDVQDATSVDFRWNTVHMHNAAAAYPIVRMANDGSGYTWDFNAYSSETPRAVLFDYSSSTYTFTQWKSDHSGFDANSTSSDAAEPADAIHVYPNADEPKRAHIAIFNWSESNNVSVGLSGVLNAGDAYSLYSAQNYNAGAIQTGTYNGTSISVPMTNLSAATVLSGTNAQPSATSPEFAAFVLLGSENTPRRYHGSGQLNFSGNVQWQ